MKSKVLLCVVVLVVASLLIAGACTTTSTVTTTTTATKTATQTTSIATSTSPQPTSATTTSTQTLKQTLKLGATLPLSGPASVAGLAAKQGMELAVDKINKDGGIKAGNTVYTLQFSAEDDMGTPDGAATAGTKLCLQNGVKYLLGEFQAATYTPLLQITNQAGALLVNSMLPAGAETPGCFADVGPDKPLYIRIAVCHNEDAVTSFKYLFDNYPNVKKIGMVSLAFPDYDPLADYYGQLWAPLGKTISSDYERVPPDMIDFTSILTRMMTTNPDALFLYSTTPSQFILIVQTARNMGFDGPIVYGPPFDPSYIANVVPNLSDVLSPGCALTATNLPDSVKEVITMAQAKYGKDFVQDGLFFYDEVMLLAQTIAKAGSVDPQKVQDTFETLKNPGDLTSIFGKAYVGGLKTTGVNRVVVKPNPLSRVMNGKGEFLGMFSKEIP